MGFARINDRVLLLKKYLDVRSALIILLITLLFPQIGRADPWVATGNERVRHHLQNLLDHGEINIPITGWPVMWVDIKNALEQTDPLRLNPSALWSYQLLKHELRLNTKKFTSDKRLYASNHDKPLADFSSTAREGIEAAVGLSYVGDKTSYRLEASYAHDPIDGHENRLDGSYLSRLVGNWSFSAGSIDRWWGPGWQSSLILSNNARPIPGVFIQRNRAKPFDLPVLKYLGPWQLTTFMGQMESRRGDYESPLLWGMRVNFRPIQSLEIGLSRTAMWSGEGRPGGLDTFFNVLLGRDNRGDDGNKKENEPGNQLAGYDIRWSGRINSLSIAAYGQLIGEDEANGAPSRHMGLAGIEVSGLWSGVHWRSYFEAQNTMADFYGNTKFPDTAYEHGIYTDGYRYRSRVVGASTDNDTEAYTLGNQFYFSNGHHSKVTLGYYRINFDNSGQSSTEPSAPNVNAYGNRATKATKLEISHFAPLSDRFAVTLGGYYFSDDVPFFDQAINLGGFIQFDSRW